MSGIGVVLALLIIGFVCGYAVRELMSRRRRAEAKRRGVSL
jgi:type II secretory pathway pseudopilin PulG